VLAAAPRLHGIVYFELPSRWFAGRLKDHVGSERFAWQHEDEGIAVVGVALTSDELDLAHLLRAVQAWLDCEGLPSIRFELDDRTYVLEARREVAVTD
jgi:hypothetical protein